MAGENGIAGVIAATAVASTAPLATPADTRLPADPALPSTPAAATVSIKPELSSAARLLVLLADTSQAPAPVPLPPLLPVPQAAPVQIAQALREGIAHSGLFYESHQADWVAGQRELETLKQEPQAKQAASGAADDATLPAIVRQQLDLLDGQPLAWRGELWPGLPLQLSIARDDRRGDGTTPAAPDELPAWQTTLVSHLPALGRTTARLRLEGDQLWLELRSADPAQARLLGEQAGSLQAALQAGGLSLQSFASRTDDTP